ncbi:MAG TPA: PA2778 family cysteine peptidase [Spongiibacteraceae bacterium]
MQNARCFAGIFIFTLTFLLQGCATPQTAALRAQFPTNLPRQAELESVPYYAQEAHQCGPASLAMAFGAAGKTIDPQQIEPQVYLPDKLGTLQVEMLAATRRNGLLAYELDPQLSALLGEIAAGHPVIILQNLGLSWYPVWHYAVAIGYDFEREQLILRSGPERRQAMPLTTFEHTWARSNYWGMLILPPYQMPAHAEEERYIAAALALEQTKQIDAAHLAYAAAMQHWPNNLNASMGAGNTAYALGHFSTAESAFRNAAQHHPESGAAFNNLADTLAQQKKYKPALAAARRAVQIGGDQRATFVQTLHEIETKVAAQTPPKKVSQKSVVKKQIAATKSAAKKSAMKKSVTKIKPQPADAE